MQIFVSYASQQRKIADRIALGLRNQGHEVFFDRDNLPPGEEYDARIRQEIKRADLFLFLVSPDSITEQRYTLTEVGFARELIKRTSNRVLPVMVEPTPFSDIPAFLTAVSVLEPKGNNVAETLAAVAKIVRRRRNSLIRRAAAVLVLLAVLIGVAPEVERYLDREHSETEPTQCYLSSEIRATGEVQPGLLLKVSTASGGSSFVLDDRGQGPLDVALAGDSIWRIELVDRDGVSLGAAQITGCPAATTEVTLDDDLSISIRPR